MMLLPKLTSTASLVEADDAYDPVVIDSPLEELQGVKLLLDPSNSTGYEGVYDKGERYPRSRFQAARTIKGRRKHLGSFPTAAQAALCIARSMQTSPQ